MLIRIPKPWELPERAATAEAIAMNRRQLLASGAFAAATFVGCKASASAPEIAGPKLFRASGLPATRNRDYIVAERPITAENLATTYNNFYEFTSEKEGVHELVGQMPTDPWTVEVGGECHQPKKFDLAELVKKMPIEERVYRFRCVEAWSMTVPWTGFPLKALLDRVEPKKNAKYVRFVTFDKAKWAPSMERTPWYPWPYAEGLTIEEAAHPLTLMVTGMYGKDLPRQNGAPIRLIVPWKYGFKSAKSIVKIELTEAQPKTFWNELAPTEYGFFSNVDPKTPHPRWSQATERLLDDGQRIPTLPFNGYASAVASLYPSGKTYF
jgi:sulfoxide reductase catalytic subunit YedY